MNDSMNMKKGDMVIFGRRNGEQTVGEIVRVNPKSYKIKQIGTRGTQKSHAEGTVWRVGKGLVRPYTGGEITKPTPEPEMFSDLTTEEQVMREAAVIASGRSPENLACDGEASSAHIRRMWAHWNRAERSLLKAARRIGGQALVDKAKRECNCY